MEDRAFKEEQSNSVLVGLVANFAFLTCPNIKQQSAVLYHLESINLLLYLNSSYKSSFIQMYHEYFIILFNLCHLKTPKYFIHNLRLQMIIIR